MRIEKFAISNFKGIKDTTIEIADGERGNVITLIGLNESGKTTILEAISHFSSEDRETTKLVGTVQKKSSIQDIVPRNKKAAFTDDISISATISLDRNDHFYLINRAEKELGIIIDPTSLQKAFSIDAMYTFSDSVLKDSTNAWGFTFKARYKKSKKYFLCDGDEKSSPASMEAWSKITEYIQEHLPKIVYFPTFTFNFPERVYLEGESSEVNSYYKQIIQDVLDSQGNGLDVQRHIVGRVARYRDKVPNPAVFLPLFLAQDEKKQIDAVCQEVAGEITRVVFGSWNKILGQGATGKRVHIDWSVDSEKNNAPFLEFSIVEGQSKYTISERSLGFRWFFSFLLFTQFRRSRKGVGANIFLFDEPASNLHSKAQMKLLDSLAKIATGSTYIIFSTHSHYLVNPLWLNKAYIVRNTAVNYESSDENAYGLGPPTDVTAVRYRTFVGQNPTETTYFQPALDALGVGMSPLMESSRALIVEGINDYYALLYLYSRRSKIRNFQFFPGNGAGDLRTLVSLYRGWGVKFRILLDDDKAGRDGRTKHLTECLLAENEIRTIGEIVPNLSGFAMERAYAGDLRAHISQYFQVDKVTKKHFSLFFQHLIATNKDIDLPETQLNLAPLFDWIEKELADELY